MGLSDFTNFFLAGTGAGAALIGLLFVAVSVRPGLLASRHTHSAVQAAVAMAFTALVNGFFISFAALLPQAFLGGIALFMGALSTWSCLNAAYGLIRYQFTEQMARGWLTLARGLMLILPGFIIYGWEIAAGWRAAHAPNDVGFMYEIAILVIAAFGLGLVRAWELLGARSGAGLLRWLSPLRDIDELQPPPISSETRTAAGDADTDNGDNSHA